MCDKQFNFTHPLNNSFYYHYLQQHATMSYHFQKLHSNIHHGTPFYDVYNLANSCHPVDYSSSCSSCSSCSCCSSESCTKSSSSEYEEEEMDSEEGYDENYDEDESECEYEFNVDAILQMRAVKEELKKQELLESKKEGSAEPKDEKSSESNDEESSDSKDERESKSDSIVVVDSDREDFEFIDLSSSKILDFKLYQDVGGFHKTKEGENRKVVMKCIYGGDSGKVLALETEMELNFEKYYDDYQPALWPVLPLRL